jgi:hypothetical protein
MLMFPLIALALSAALDRPAEPPAEAAFIVLVPEGDGLHASNDRLIVDTERLLMALQAEGRLGYRRASISPTHVRACLRGGADPSDQRRACLRRLLPWRERGAPVVAIVIGYTQERGAWQRMECIGPRNAGFQLSTYVNEGFHPRADIRARSRSELLQCVREALGF